METGLSAAVSSLTAAVSVSADFAEAGADSVDAGADSVDSGADSVDAGADSVDSGADSVDAGADSVDAGADSVYSGADSVDSGADSVDTGADSVSGSDSDAFPVSPADVCSDSVSVVCTSAQALPTVPAVKTAASVRAAHLFVFEKWRSAALSNLCLFGISCNPCNLFNSPTPFTLLPHSSGRTFYSLTDVRVRQLSCHSAVYVIKSVHDAQYIHRSLLLLLLLRTVV